MKAKANQLSERLVHALQTFETRPQEALAELEELYDEQVTFSDPLQTLHGRAEFMAMNRRLVRRARRLAFNVHDRAVGEAGVFLYWTMDYAPRFGPTMSIPGTSYLRLNADGLIVEHQDQWDLLSSAISAVPGVRSLYRAATRLAGRGLGTRLASG